MPPASILFPGLDGKAGPTRDLPAPTAPLGRKPNSPLPLGNAVRGVGPRGTEAATGCRMSWSGSEGSVCHSPPPDGPEGAGEALHTVLGLLQIAVALPAELVRHSPSRSGNPPPPLLLGEGKVPAPSYRSQSMAGAQKGLLLGTPSQGFFPLQS